MNRTGEWERVDRVQEIGHVPKVERDSEIILYNSREREREIEKESGRREKEYEVSGRKAEI